MIMNISLERFEKLLIFLVFLSFPFMDTRVVAFGVPLYLPEGLLLSALLLRSIRLFRGGVPRRSIPKSVAFASILLFFGVISSAVMNGMDREALGAIKSWFLFPMLFSWLVFTSGFTEHDSWRAIRFWFSVIALFAASSLLFPGFSDETYDGRLRSVFPSPNHFGFFLEYGTILGVGLMVFLKKDRIALPLLILSEAAVVSALLLTRSDGAILSAAIGSLIVLVAATFPMRISRRIFFDGTIVFFSLLLFLFVSIDRDAVGNGTSRDSFSSRVMVWNASFRMISDRPISGVGPRNFQEEYLALQPEFPRYLEWAVPHPHNIFLSFWLFAGMAGFLGFLLLLGSLLRRAIRETFPVAGTATIFPGLLLALLSAFLVHGTVDTPYFRNDLTYAFWAVAALVLIPRNEKDAEASKGLCKL